MNHYFEKIHQGLPLSDVEIIDIHAHLGPNGVMHIPRNSAEDMVQTMDACGIDKVVVSAHAGIDADIVLGNNMVFDAISKFPGRIFGACMVNGHYPDLSVDELNRCFGHAENFKIIKIHPFSTSCGLNDKRMNPILKFAADRRMVVLVHTWLDGDEFGNLEIFKNMAVEYPSINWIMGHSGGPFGSYHAAEIAKKLKNVYLDLTISMGPARQVEYFVNEVGAERVLFGTDNPFLDPRPQVGRVGLADISEEAKKNIFGSNARRLVKFDE